jgi:RNA 3'-terminal phosphate cyclase (ATP)
MLEGGGQIIRTSITLAALLEEAVEIVNIRGKRSPPGLKAQHMTAVQAVARISGAEVEGLTIGSRELTFSPSTRRGGSYTFDVGTAGSISLVLQAVMPVAAYVSDPLKIKITGGTDVRWSPPIDYIQLITLPILAKTGYQANLTVEVRGHYPRGGGSAILIMTPLKQLHSITLEERGIITKVSGNSHCVKLPKHVAERQAKTASHTLKEAGIRDVEIDVEWHPPHKDFSIGPGSGITLSAATSTDTILGGDAIGEKGKPAEEVGREAASHLLEALNKDSALDRHMGDMFIPYMAVADGKSTVTVSQLTLHTLTNIKVTEMIAGVSFQVEGKVGNPGKISVEGLGVSS